MAGDNPFAFVFSANLHRRHLNETQRTVLAAKLANIPRGGDMSEAHLRASLSKAEAAALLKVSKLRQLAKLATMKRGDNQHSPIGGPSQADPRLRPAVSVDVSDVTANRHVAHSHLRRDHAVGHAWVGGR